MIKLPGKKKNDIKRLNTIIYVALEIIRKVTIMLYPIMPSTSLKVLKIFSISENEIEFKSIIDNSFLKANTKIAKLDILFKKTEKND